jgi:hypothetical protein
VSHAELTKYRADVVAGRLPRDAQPFGDRLGGRALTEERTPSRVADELARRAVQPADVPVGVDQVGGHLDLLEDLVRVAAKGGELARERGRRDNRLRGETTNSTSRRQSPPLGNVGWSVG